MSKDSEANNAFLALQRQNQEIVTLLKKHEGDISKLLQENYLLDKQINELKEELRKHKAISGYCPHTMK